MKIGYEKQCYISNDLSRAERIQNQDYEKKIE